MALLPTWVTPEPSAVQVVPSHDAAQFQVAEPMVVALLIPPPTYSSPL